MMKPRSRLVPLFLAIGVMLVATIGVFWVKRGLNSEDRSNGARAGTKFQEDHFSSPAEADRLVQTPAEILKPNETPIVSEKNPAHRSAAMEKIAARMSTRSDDLQLVIHPDGRESIHLRGRFMHLSAKVTRADGTSAVQCFSDVNALEAAVSK